MAEEPTIVENRTDRTDQEAVMLPNYARRTDVDEEIKSELTEAGINAAEIPEIMRDHHPEMRTVIIGQFFGWTFTRQRYYWKCVGPGIEVQAAEKLHEEIGKEVRVDGHFCCPSPMEHFAGLACGHYHVDSQRGLNALAATIRQLTTAG